MTAVDALVPYRRRLTTIRAHACLAVVGAGLAVVVQGSVPAGAAARQDATSGRLTGVVHLTAVTARSSASAYDRRSVGPRPKALAEATNVIVFFEGLAAPAGMKPTPASIVQKDEQFVPHVVAITTGSNVEFPNQDPFFHNVFSLSKPATFDLGRFPPGSSRGRTFSRPGLVKVYCEIHSHMSAVARVFNHPWFTIPDAGGAFVINGVPPGEHTVVAWHERIGERRDKVVIRPGAATTISFTLPVLEPSR
jgi:plastocyanin